MWILWITTSSLLYQFANSTEYSRLQNWAEAVKDKIFQKDIYKYETNTSSILRNHTLKSYYRNMLKWRENDMMNNTISYFQFVLIASCLDLRTLTPSVEAWPWTCSNWRWRAFNWGWWLRTSSWSAYKQIKSMNLNIMYKPFCLLLLVYVENICFLIHFFL